MGLKEALSDYNKETESEGKEENLGERDGANEEHAAVIHINHGKHHSTHKISHDGSAQSETHQAGEGGDGCPHCGA